MSRLQSRAVIADMVLAIEREFLLSKLPCQFQPSVGNPDEPMFSLAITSPSKRPYLEYHALLNSNLVSASDCANLFHETFSTPEAERHFLAIFQSVSKGSIKITLKFALTYPWNSSDFSPESVGINFCRIKPLQVPVKQITLPVVLGAPSPALFNTPRAKSTADPRFNPASVHTDRRRTI